MEKDSKTDIGVQQNAPLHEQIFRDTDLGHAEQLVEEHGEDFLYCPEMGGWLVWNGVRWEPDKSGGVYRRTYEMLKHNLECATGTHNQQAMRKIVEAMKDSRINGIVNLATRMARVRINADSFDVNPYLFNVLNGTIDLRTGQIRDHSRDDLITKLSPVMYDPMAKAPTWYRFIRRVLPDGGLGEIYVKPRGKPCAVILSVVRSI